MMEKSRTSRLAGFLYSGVVLTGLFSLMYVPSKLIVYENAFQTYQNILNSLTFYRFGIVIGLLCYLLFLFLPIILYKLLHHVDENIAKLMVLLAIISVPMYFLNVQNELTILSLINDPNLYKNYTTQQIQSQVMIYINHYDNGMKLIHVFSGLWLFPFGYLVYKSKFLPKFFGILLMLGSIGYLLNFLGKTLISNYSALGVSVTI